jgi:RHS repeat-associated protein
MLNDSVTVYQYDGRGNATVKQYADGTREQWTWNAFDLQTLYTDRDDVQTRYEYDDAGNCIRIIRGGETLFAGTYGTLGKIIQSRTGNRETEYYTYDARGYIASRAVTVNGQVITEYWVHDALGRVKEYTDGAGRKWTYTYNAKTTVEKTPMGLERTYTYNSRKDLVSVREVDVVTREVREQAVTYDKRHLATSVKDGAGNITEYAYREDGLMTQKRQGAWIWEYSYDEGGRLKSVTRSMDGSNETYTEQYAYEWQGAEEKRNVVQPNNTVTQYRYDSWGRIIGVTNALGETSARMLSGAGRVLKEQAASGGNFVCSYDSSGRLIGAGRENDTAVQVSYNSDGTIAEKTDRNGVKTRYFYDGRGLLIREENPQGEKSYRYDGVERVVHSETASSNTQGSAKYYTDWEYNDAARTVTVIEGGKYRSVLELNAWEEAVAKTDGVGNRFGWKYNGAGALVSAVDGYGNETKYEWNAIGKVVKITYPDATVTNYEYTSLGLVTKITDGEGIQWQGGYDSAGRLAWEKGRPGIDKQYVYDALGRITEVKTGGVVTEKYAYSNRGKNITYIDGKGQEFDYVKNEYGELIGEKNRLGGTMRYSFDKEGRQTERIEYSGKQIRTVYNDAAGTTTTQYADGTQSIITRDMSGSVVSAQGETGIIRYRYDAGGMLIEQNDESAGERTTYQYDSAGRRVRMQSGNRDVNYTYGKNGELKKVFDNTQKLMVEYQYNVLGLETKRVYGNGIQQELFYDKAGRTVLIRELNARNELLRAEGYVYDDAGRRYMSVDEAGNVTKYQYDGQSRLSVALYPWTDEKSTSDKQEAEEAGLFFTANSGNPERYTISSVDLERVRAVLNKASYNRGALVNMNQTVWRESYTYDANGNRLSKTTPWGTIRYTYDTENRLVSKGTITYTYDKDGNLLTEIGSRKTAKYEYSGSNRMKYSEVTDLTGNSRATTVYKYDAYGRRTITQGSTADAMRTLYDGFTFEAIREGATFRSGGFTTNYTATAVQVATAPANHTEGTRYRYITDDDSGDSSKYRNTGDSTSATVRYTGINVTLYGRGEAVAMNRTSSDGIRGGTAYLGKDILGSVRSVSNDYGNLDDRYEYDAFGKPYKGDLESGMNLGYTGKPYDAATGLYNYGYRDYKPEQARFTTVDPIRDGVNWFAYVNGDPVNWVDLWGLAEIYGDDVITGKPVVASDGRDLKAETTIEVQRNANPGNYNDTLSIKIGSQTIYQAPVQSEANIPEPRLTAEYSGRTLEAGAYTGTLLSQSISYEKPIQLVDAFLIHPNEYTVQTKRDSVKDPGPWNAPSSAGCQILNPGNFDTMTQILEGLGFTYNSKDTINVTINDDKKDGANLSILYQAAAINSSTANNSNNNNDSNKATKDDKKGR